MATSGRDAVAGRDAVDETVSAGLDEVLRATFGADYVTDAAEGQRVLEAARRAAAALDEMRKRNQRQETASVPDKEHHHAVISVAEDGAKIVQNLETLAKTYENISGSRKNFLEGHLYAQIVFD